MTRLNIISLNVRGLNHDKKRQILLNWFTNNHGDIVFMQETFCKSDYSNLNNSQWETKHSHTDSTHSRGVSITFNKKLDYKIQNVHRKQDGRVILVNCLVKGVETTL